MKRNTKWNTNEKWRWEIHKFFSCSKIQKENKVCMKLEFLCFKFSSRLGFLSILFLHDFFPRIFNLLFIFVDASG